MDPLSDHISRSVRCGVTVIVQGCTVEKIADDLMDQGWEMVIRMEDGKHVRYLRPPYEEEP